MLFVIATRPDGSVAKVEPCHNGIDQAIEIIAGELCHPEEDWAAACDVVAERWADAIAGAELNGTKAVDGFAISRPRHTALRFGLAEIGPTWERCSTCHELVERDRDGAWVDAGTAFTGARLVFCHDQDETHDGIRHEVRA